MKKIGLACALAIVLGATFQAHAAPTITSGYIESFDLTTIYYTLFKPAGASSDSKVPIIFQGPGWSMSGATTATGQLGGLVNAGYGALTWDPRGFGKSGDVAHTDSQDYEVRDVGKLIDMVAALDWVKLDGPGDPVMGMIGASYGGGIQLEVAAADHRVDAIAPQISWNDLPQSLKPNGVLKLHWDLPLYGVGVEGGTGLTAKNELKVAALAPEIHQSFVEGLAMNDWSAETYAWYADKSPARYINGGTSMGGRTVPGIVAPALIWQGANDTLFPINQGVASWRQILANSVDARIIFFCGSLLGSGEAAVTHTIDVGNPCTTTGASHIYARVRAWFDHYLLNLPTDLGSQVEYQTQSGSFHGLNDLPATTVSASGSGTVVSAVAPTNGAGTAPRPAADGVRIPVAAGPFDAVGIPHVTGSVSGVGLESYLFFKLLDIAADGSAVVIDDQTMPQRLFGLSDVPQALDLDLGGVSWSVPSGHQLVLEVTSTSNEYASSRLPSVATFDLSVSVPFV